MVPSDVGVGLDNGIGTGPTVKGLATAAVPNMVTPHLHGRHEHEGKPESGGM